jgi:hypothetical protein
MKERQAMMRGEPQAETVVSRIARPRSLTAIVVDQIAVSPSAHRIPEAAGANMALDPAKIEIEEEVRV